MEKLLDLVGGKKIGWCLILLALSTVAFFLGRMDQKGWWDAAEFLTYAAIGGNVAAMAIHGFAPKKVSSDAKKEG